MKRYRALAVVLVMIAALSGCGTLSSGSNSSANAKTDAEKSSPAVKDKALQIGLVMKTLTNPFFIEMEKGARKAEEEFGINLKVQTGAEETSIDQQIAIVNEMINSKVDAIVIAPGSSTELIPVLKKAKEAQIPIINIDNRLDPEMSRQLGLTDIPFISVDNRKAAYQSAKYISDMIKTPTKAVIIEGIRGADNAEQRKLGALDAFKENPNIKLIASETANWKIDEGSTLASKLLEANPDIGAFFCANDMMALGVIHALEKGNRNGVLVAAFDNLTEARKEIENGRLMVTIDQQPEIQGYYGVKYAIEIIKGNKVPMETLIDVKVIDSKSLKK